MPISALAKPRLRIGGFDGAATQNKDVFHCSTEAPRGNGLQTDGARRSAGNLDQTAKPRGQDLKTPIMDFSHTDFRLSRNPLSYSKVQRVISAAIRNRRAFADIKQPGTYLDVGCGRNIHPDFCNLDYGWHPGIDVCWDIGRGLPFPSRYVGGVFTEHCLEHFTLEAGLTLLAELYRVMHPGAVLRIVVPDGELYLRGYVARTALPFAQGDAEHFPLATPMVSVNRIFRYHGHLFIWDFETLAAALYKCGFQTVNKAAFGVGRDNKLLIDTPRRKVESLYVEAVA